MSVSYGKSSLNLVDMSVSQIGRSRYKLCAKRLVDLIHR